MTEAEVLPPTAQLLGMEDVEHARPICAHSHDFGVISLARAGHASHQTEKGLARVGAGTLTLLGPSSWHAYEPDPVIELTNLYMTRALLAVGTSRHLTTEVPAPLRDALDPENSQGSVISFALTEPDVTALKRVFAQVRGDDGPRSIFSQLALYYQLLDALVPAVTAAPMLMASSSADHQHSPLAPGLRKYGEHVTHAIALLHDRIDHPWTLGELAAGVSISSSQLVRTFRADTGSAPIAYLQSIRAERMAYLLRTTDLSIAAVGRAVGWPDPSYASRRFNAHWRLSPSAYRRGLS
ncbi:helix-turn-helix domain-containing protein [Microbacterium sp. SY138]